MDFQWLTCVFELLNQRGVTLSPFVLFTSFLGLPKEPLFACFKDMIQAIFDEFCDLHDLCPEVVLPY